MWVSEYRIESGLNCGGHAFATEGFLMGPILDEFKNHKAELIASVHEILIDALNNKNRTIPEETLPLKITAQGEVGTAEEHQFLIDHYQIDSVGWGTPFLLVPEATNVDEQTRSKLIEAKEKDLYLSNISPLGVPFNNLRGTTKNDEKQSLIDKGKPGSPCLKHFLVFNKEFTEKSICTASRQYQQKKIKELDKEELPTEEHQRKFDEITDKTCLCMGLGASALKINKLTTRVEENGVSVCPGPNMAYFSKEMSLKEITDHIYGRSNVITRTDRPNMFIKELNIYIDFLKKKTRETKGITTEKNKKYLSNFANNLKEGIDYYDQLFSKVKDKFHESLSIILSDLKTGKETLDYLNAEIEKLSIG